MSIVSRYEGIQSSYGHFIDGQWTEGVAKDTFRSIDPSTEDILAHFQAGNSEDIHKAVSAAKKAFISFSKWTVAERASLLNKIADALEARAADFAVMESMDNGKPIRETRMADIPASIDHFRYFAAVIRGEEDTSFVIDEHTESYNYQEPLGVVGQIIPWNFPLLMAAWKIAPALAAGNTIVLKPAEQTPLTIMEFCKLTQSIIPDGVLNVVTGYGPDAGAPLVEHADVKKVAFTGSSAVGKIIAETAAKTMKPVTLELGGKSPNIVFPDAPMAKAIEGLVMGALFNQGEVCTCGSRALVHSDIYDEVKAGLIKRFEQVKVGNPLDESVSMGAQASKEQFEKICGYLDKANSGSEYTVLAGGAPHKVGSDGVGYFVKPTLVETDNGSCLAQEEIFGPVLSLIKFSSDDDALRIANDTDYGLGAGVWTKDANRIRRMTKGIEAGRVWVNTYHAYPSHAPFGGYKQSGIGRETHKMMLAAYRQNKNVIISYSENETGLYPD